MNLHVLGCSGAIAAGCKTTAFLLDDNILIDAGTGVGDLPLEALARVDHVLISHSHLDHVLSIGLLADSVLRLRKAQNRPAIQVRALPETLAALRQHIFNGVDLARLHPPAQPREPSARTPAHRHRRRAGVERQAHRSAQRIAHRARRRLCGRRRQRRLVGLHRRHRPQPALWQRLQHMKVAHLVIETAFSDDERQLARISRHLCPTALGAELAQLSGSVDVHITHIKPGEMEAVMAEIGRLGTPHQILCVAAGQVIELG